MRAACAVRAPRGKGRSTATPSAVATSATAWAAKSPVAIVGLVTSGASSQSRHDSPQGRAARQHAPERHCRLAVALTYSQDMISTHTQPVELAAAKDVVRIRRIAPADAPALEEFYAGLSPDSRRLRFLSLGTRFGDRDARYFCRSDHEHREGFVAEISTTRGDAQIVGHLCLEPAQPDEMEIAVAVADEFQHRGIGRRLVAEAATWAAAHGVARFRAWFAPDNIGIRRLLECRERPIVFGPWSSGTVEIAIDLSAAAPARPKAA